MEATISPKGYPRSSQAPPHLLPRVRAGEVLARVRSASPRGAELGVWRGEMSEHLLKLRPGLFLYMIDRWSTREAQPGGPRMRITQDQLVRGATDRTHFAAERRCILRMDTVSAADHVADGSLDFVFIDADHSYEAVRADIDAWLPKLRPGALLSGHDYSPPGRYSATGWPGVVMAVHELVDRTGWPLEFGDNATWFVRLP